MSAGSLRATCAGMSYDLVPLHVYDGAKSALVVLGEKKVLKVWNSMLS